MDSLMEKDLYELLGVPQTASTQEIKTAYRKKALSCHPDKNPNNPKAAELFHELSRILEVLIDSSARAAYDKVLNAKHQAKLRVRELDAKRKKLKEDLEAREDAYRRSSTTDYNLKSDKAKLQAEIERLQKEGSRQVEEEIALMKKQLGEQINESCKESKDSSGSYKIKIRWKSDPTSPSNNVYNYDTLHRIFSKYGDIAGLVVSPTNKGRALIEYQNKSDAETAFSMEIGFVQNPLKLQKLWDSSKQTSSFTRQDLHSVASLAKGAVNQEMSDAEFENIVLGNLRRAEERKRNLEKSNLEEGT